MIRQEHGLLAALWQVLRSPVPPTYRGALAFGWWILFLFLVQVITGCLLSFYYQPSPDMAPESVRFIMRDVNWGWLMRGVHHWASYGMVVLGFLQLVKVLIIGVYRGPRASHWFLGFLLMATVLLFAWSGDVLRWDQEAYQSISRALEDVARIPGVGPGLAVAMRGGEEITGSTLSRAYSLHAMLLPWLTFFLVLANLWLLARGSGRRQEAGR